jgi:hypothetical protein
MPEISEQEHELFNTYRALGEPEQIQALLQERENLRTQTLINDAAQATGFKPSVLAKLVDGLEVKVDNGKAYVGDVPMEDYANEHWTDFLPSLKSESTSNGLPFVKQPTIPNNGKVDRNREVTNYLSALYGQQAAN